MLISVVDCSDAASECNQRQRSVASRHAGLASLGLRARPRRRWLWCGLCFQPASPQRRLSTRRSPLTRRGCPSPSPSALAWLLRAAGVSTASPLDTPASPDSAWALVAVVIGFGMRLPRAASFSTASHPDTLAPLDSTWMLIAVAVGSGVASCLPRRLCRDCSLIAVAVGIGAASACSRHRFSAAPHARWSCSTRLHAHRRCRWLRLVTCVRPASASFRVTCTPVLLRSLSCSSPLPLASARLLRPAGVGPTLRHPHAGLASLACGLTSVAAGFGAAFACGRRQPSAAPLASWSRFACSPAPCRRRWRWLVPCAQPSSARSAPLARWSGLTRLHACRRCHWLRRGLCVQLVLARYCTTACWPRFGRLRAHRPRRWLRRDLFVHPASARLCVLLARRSRSLACALAVVAAGFHVASARVHPASAWCCATRMLVLLFSSACSPPSPLASAWLLRAAGAGSALCRLHAGFARLCVRRRRHWLRRDFCVHPAPAQRCALARWSRSARLHARRRRRWLRRGFCVHPCRLDPSHSDELPGTSSSMPL